jgi:hypothetical protein
MQFAFGSVPALMIDAAIHYGVFDILERKPRALDEMSIVTGGSLRGMKAVLNGLVGIGLLAKNEGEIYALTSESATFLVSGKPAYHGGIFRHVARQILPNWLHLPEAMGTGKPVIAVQQEEEGGAFFREFVEALFGINYCASQALADALDLVKSNEPVGVLDLAAGSGVWSIALAQRSRNIRVIAVDFPEVLSVTKRIAKKWGVADQFSYAGGDLLSIDFGVSHQIAILGHILHSEGEERSRAVIQKTYAALAPGGTIIIADWLVNDARTAPAHALIFAVNMLVHTTDGDTFSFGEIQRWLQDAGFETVRLLEVPAPSPLVLATKPGN